MKQPIICPQCGATLIDKGSFCSYCGCKLEDEATKIEINHNIHVEDVAAMKKAEQEAKLLEFQLQKEKKIFRRRNLSRNIKFGSTLALFLSLMTFFFALDNNIKFLGQFSLGAGVISFVVMFFSILFF